MAINILGGDICVSDVVVQGFIKCGEIGNANKPWTVEHPSLVNLQCVSGRNLTHKSKY